MDKPTREELMLRQVWNNAFDYPAWDEAFFIEDRLPVEVVRQIAGPADVAAALDCWRNKMIAAVDAVARRFKEEVGHED